MTGEPSTPGRRGFVLLSAHCRSLDPAVPTARERLEGTLGPELAHVLLFALAGPGVGSLRCAV
jgi:hypothetical protein